MIEISGDISSLFQIYFHLGLQMTDVELDERVTALEENDGSGTENGKLNDKFMEIYPFFVSEISTK